MARPPCEFEVTIAICAGQRAGDRVPSQPKLRRHELFSTSLLSHMHIKLDALVFRDRGDNA